MRLPFRGVATALARVSVYHGLAFGWLLGAVIQSTSPPEAWQAFGRALDAVAFLVLALCYSQLEKRVRKLETTPPHIEVGVSFRAATEEDVAAAVAEERERRAH